MSEHRGNEPAFPPWVNFLIGEGDVLANPENFPLDPEACISQETWLNIAREIYRLNEDQDPRMAFAARHNDGLVEYPVEGFGLIATLAGQAGQPEDSIIELYLAHWLKAQGHTDGRRITHVRLDLRRPGYLEAQDRLVSYPDRVPIKPYLNGKATNQEVANYFAETGDTISYVEREYIVSEDGGKRLVAFLSSGQRQDEQEQEEVFVTQLKDLEPGLRQACHRYFIEGRSLVFDPEIELGVIWQEIDNPFANNGSALIAYLPGRTELYLPPVHYRAGKFREKDKWAKLIWHKENFPDDFLLTEEPNEVAQLSFEEALENVPEAQRAYIQEVQAGRLSSLIQLMQRDRFGRRGIRPEEEPGAPEEYRELYQRYITAFPDDQDRFPPELPD